MLELFITGTEQNPNKRYITAGLALTMQSLGYTVGVYKPVATGAIPLAGMLKAPEIALINYYDPYIKTYSTYTFVGKEDPLVAAYTANQAIDPVKILQDYQNLLNVNEITLIEGTNGLATPFAKNFLEEDLIKAINTPLLFVVSCMNSSVNNIITAINHAGSKGIQVRGIIINDYPPETTDLNKKYLPRMVEEYTDSKILGIMNILPDQVNPNDLISNIITGIDVEAVLRMKIAKLQI